MFIFLENGLVMWKALYPFILHADNSLYCIVFCILLSLEKKFHNKQFCSNMWNIQEVT